MRWEEFSYIFFKQDFYFILSLFISIFLILYVFFRKNIYSFFDPLFMMTISLSACYSVIFYLKIKSYMHNSIYLQLITINAVFLLFFKFFIIKKQKNKHIDKIKYSKFQIFYYYNTILFIILILIFFKFVGLNIFVNKFSVFSNIGILNYLRRAIIPGQLILLLIKREVYKVKNKKDKYFFILILLMFFFSGGKTSTVSYVMYIYSMYYIFYRNNVSETYKFLKKNEKKILIIALIGVIFLIKIIHKEKGLVGIFERLIFRIISFGDTYYMIYPTDLFKELNIPNLNEYYLYRLILPLLRRIGYEGDALGFKIVEKLYNLQKAWTGPNTRADIILQLNLGYLGVIISVVNAFFMAFLRKINTQNYLKLYVYINLFIISETIIIDFSIFAMSLVGIILVIFPGIFIVEIIYIILKYKNQEVGEKYEKRKGFNNNPNV